MCFRAIGLCFCMIVQVCIQAIQVCRSSSYVFSLFRCVSVCARPGMYPGYPGMLPPELARDHAAVVAAAAAAADGMNPLAGLNSLSPAGLAYARAAMVCLSVTLSVCLSLCTLHLYC